MSYACEDLEGEQKGAGVPDLQMPSEVAGGVRLLWLFGSSNLWALPPCQAWEQCGPWLLLLGGVCGVVCLPSRRRPHFSEALQVSCYWYWRKQTEVVFLF